MFFWINVYVVYIHMVYAFFPLIYIYGQIYSPISLTFFLFHLMEYFYVLWKITKYLLRCCVLYKYAENSFQDIFCLNFLNDRKWPGKVAGLSLVSSLPPLTHHPIIYNEIVESSILFVKNPYRMACEQDNLKIDKYCILGLTKRLLLFTRNPWVGLVCRW